MLLPLLPTSRFSRALGSDLALDVMWWLPFPTLGERFLEEHSVNDFTWTITVEIDLHLFLSYHIYGNGK